MAAEMRVPFLGTIPIDPDIAETCDRGSAFIYSYGMSTTARIMSDIIQPILTLDADHGAMMNLAT